MVGFGGDVGIGPVILDADSFCGTNEHTLDYVCRSGVSDGYYVNEPGIGGGHVNEPGVGDCYTVISKLEGLK